MIFFVDGDKVFGDGEIVFDDGKADEFWGSLDFFCSIFLLKVSKNVFCSGS